MAELDPIFNVDWSKDFERGRIAKFAIRFGLFYLIIGLLMMGLPILDISIRFPGYLFLSVVGTGSLVVGFAKTVDGVGVLPIAAGILTCSLAGTCGTFYPRVLIPGLGLFIFGFVAILAGWSIRNFSRKEV